MTAPSNTGIPAQPVVAVIGAGTIGRGWAALAAAQGWPVAILDTDPRAADAAMLEIAARVRALVALGRATPEAAERGIGALRAGRSLLQACGDADWVIEAIPDLLRRAREFLE